jgi:hypothetical protein
MGERYMPDDDYSAALRWFIRELNEAWHAAGTPSYARLEVLSAGLAEESRRSGVRLFVLARSTTQEILAGKRAGAPKWVWVLSFVTALRAEARNAAVAVESIGEIDDWKRRHAVLCAAERAARHPLGAGLARGKAERDGAGPVSLMAPPLAAVVPEQACSQGEVGALRGKFLWLIKRAGGPRWWHDYPDAAPEWLAFYLYLESIACSIRTYESGVVPGLLQVAGYAHAVASRCWPDASAAEVARLVELRMRRQQMLREPGARRLWAVMEESALRDQRAGRKVMRAQLRYLINMVDQPGVAISVLPPGGIDDNATISETFTIFRFAEPHLGDVACIEQPDGGLFLYRRDDIDHYSMLMDILAIRAVTEKRDVQDLLMGILRESLW